MIYMSSTLLFQFNLLLLLLMKFFFFHFLHISLISKYYNVVFLIADYSKNIYHVIENSVETLDADVWDKLQKLIERKDAAVVKAEANAKEAM